MAIQNKPFSLEEMRTELRQVLWNFAGSIGDIYGYQRAKALLLSPGFTEEDLSKLEPDFIELDSYTIAGYMATLYEYAINGIRTVSDMTDDYEFSRDFFDGLESFDLFWVYVKDSDVSIKKCVQVVEMANARLCLDDGGFATSTEGGFLANHLSLSQVALLAGLDERTVRNATTPKAKDRLVTVNFGGRTFVDNKIAIEWLKRRGFKDTVFATDARRRDPKDGFYSEADLGAFVAEYRGNLGVGKDELARQANVDNSWLDHLEAGNLVFDKQACVSLAQALGLDPKNFTLAAFQIHQDVEAARIKAELA